MDYEHYKEDEDDPITAPPSLYPPLVIWNIKPLTLGTLVLVQCITAEKLIETSLRSKKMTRPMNPQETEVEEHLVL